MTTNDATAEDLGLKTVTIEVNDHKVEMPAGPATGLEIKEAAIKQGTNIQANFVPAGPTAQRIKQGGW